VNEGAGVIHSFPIRDLFQEFADHLICRDLPRFAELCEEEQFLLRGGVHALGSHEADPLINLEVRAHPDRSVDNRGGRLSFRGDGANRFRRRRRTLFLWFSFSKKRTSKVGVSVRASRKSEIENRKTDIDSRWVSGKAGRMSEIKVTETEDSS